ncbi:MAG: two-component regulator propeller domain-containing protein [Acidobacteriota bacterium]
MSATPRVDPEYVITQWQPEDGLPESSATSMVQTPDGYLWFGTFNGLVRFDGLNFRVYGPSNTAALPHYGVVKLHLDATGNLWVATLNGFAALFGRDWKRIQADVEPNDFPLRFSEAPNGVLYIVTAKGKGFRYRAGRMERLPMPEGFRPGGGNYLTVDGKGDLYASRRTQLSKYDGDRWTAIPIPTELKNRDANLGQVLWATGRDGQVKLVTTLGVYGFDSGRFTGAVRSPMPIDSVVHYLEDPDGTTWYSSYNNGLYRLSPDGQMRHFTVKDGFPSDSIRFVFRDREGNHWVGTNGAGLIRLVRRRILSVSHDDGIPLQPTKSVAVDQDGSLLVGIYGAGLYRVRSGRSEPVYRQGPSFVQALLMDRRQRLWIGTYSAGLHVRDKGVTKAVPAAESAGEAIEALFEDSKGRVWVGGSRRVVVYDGSQAGAVQMRDRASPVAVACFAEDPKTGEIWAGGDGGLYRFNGDFFEQVNTEGKRPLPALRSIAATADGTLWLGTALDGLLRYRVNRLAAVASPDGIAASIGAIFMQDDDLWLATTRGLWRIPRAQAEQAADQGTPDPSWQVFGAMDGMPSRETSVGHQPLAVRDRAGVLWIATLHGLAGINPAEVKPSMTDASVRVEEVWYRTKESRERNALNREGDRVEAPSDARDFRIVYAAPYFTAPSKVAFDYELQNGRTAVAAGRMRDRQLRTYELPPGENRLRLRARNGDGVWSATTTELILYRQPELFEIGWVRWAAGLLLLLAIAATGRIFWRRKSREQEAQLRRAREVSQIKARLAMVLENTGDLVGFASTDQKMMYLNRAGKRLLGLDEDRDIGAMDAWSMYTEWARELITTIGMPEALRSGSWQGYTAVRQRDGREIPVWQVIVVHRSPDGQPEFVSTFARDMTELRRSEDLLRQAKVKAEEASRMKSEFLATMSHEIRTPMNGILGMAQLLRLTQLDHDQQELVNTVYSSAEALQHLLSDILVLSKIEAGQTRLHDAQFNVRTVVEDVVNLAKVQAARRGVPLDSTVDELVPTAVIGDSVRLRQVLLNYLDNAIKFTEAGKVTLTVERLSLGEGAVTLRFAVTDSGCGIPPEKLELVFDKFAQVDSSLTRPHEGTGLGLSIVKGLVELMGGSVGVQSEIGTGSTFWATAMFGLPATPRPTGAWSKETASQEEAPATGARFRNVRVLVVEDNTVNRRVIQRLLEKMGCHVELAADGYEAVLMCSRSRYDIVLMDLMMPGLSGFDAAIRIRNLEPGANSIPIVALTASAMEEDRRQCMEAGMNGYLLKPIGMNELADALASHLPNALKN